LNIQTSSIKPIHTKKQQHGQLRINTQQNTMTQTSSSRWFSAVHLPSLTSSISPQSVIQQIGMFTGNQKLSTKQDRIMERVWEKRKQKLWKTTSVTLDKFTTEKINFEAVDIYVRGAGSFDDAEDNGQRDVHIALRGIAHTVVVLKSNSICYLLDRVVEGIRLTELEINPQTNTIVECPKFKPHEMVKLATFNDIELSSPAIADWVEEESKTKYDVIKNNCVWFSFYFYQQFLYGRKLQKLLSKISC